MVNERCSIAAIVLDRRSHDSTSQGMESAFEVTAIADEEAYELTFPLPGRALVIDGSFARGFANRTVSTRRVRFTGAGGEDAAPALAPGFRAALPKVMDTLRRLAEGL